MASSVCPVSPASVHAKCAMTVKFDQPCDVVRSEMEGRIQSTTWVDPHNQGTYTISDSSSEGRYRSVSSHRRQAIYRQDGH
jgi:hypothetical protein